MTVKKNPSSSGMPGDFVKEAGLAYGGGGGKGSILTGKKSSVSKKTKEKLKSEKEKIKKQKKSKPAPIIGSVAGLAIRAGTPVLKQLIAHREKLKKKFLKGFAIERNTKKHKDLAADIATLNKQINKLKTK